MKRLGDLRRADWIVRESDDAVAERLCMAFHYSGGAAKTSVYVHGLFPRESFWEADCMGAALWMPPTIATARAVAAEDHNGVLALSRLVVDPSVPRNGATFLLGRAMRLIDRARWPVLVTFADTWRGHTGAIYRATGWRDDGLGQPKAVFTRNGRMMSTKNGTKTRNYAQMIAMGCTYEGSYPKRRFVHDVRPMISLERNAA